MMTFGLKRITRRQPFLALPGLLAMLLMSGCAMPAVGPPGGMSGGGPGFPGGGPDFPDGGGFPGGGPGFPGGGPGFPGGGGMGDAEEVCFCDVSQIPVCCDECPQAPACQPGQR